MTDETCQCGGLSNLQFCEKETVVETGNITLPEPANIIGLDDEILVIRTGGNGVQVYQGKVRELSSTAALFLLELAASIMPETDPADGKSLWLDQGFVRVASLGKNPDG